MSEVNLVTVIIGITLALITTFCFNLGIVYQKKGLKEAKAKGIELRHCISKKRIKRSKSKRY